MTEALSQNLETNLDVAFDMLSTAAVPTLEVEGALEGEFSNLINTISANIEEAQTNFVDLAVKSNVSSINKFVLNENTDNNEAILQVENAAFETEIEPKINIENNIESKVEVDILEPVSNLQQAEPIKEENKLETIQNVSDEAEIKEVEAKIALNVTSDDIKIENNNIEDKKEILQEPIENIIISCFDILNQNNELQQLKTSFEKDFSNIESVDELNELELSVDNVISSLKEADLAPEKKNQIEEAFLKVKEAIKQAKTNVEQLSNEKTEIIDEAKKVLDEIVIKTAKNNNQKIETGAIQTQEVELTNLIPKKLGASVDEFDALDAKEKAIEPTNTLELSAKNKVEIQEVSAQTSKETIELQQLNEEIKPLLDNLNSLNEKDTQKVLKLLNEFKDNTALNKDEKLQVENIIKQISQAPQAREVISSAFKNLENENELEASTFEIDENLLKEVENVSKNIKTEKIDTSSKKLDKSIEETVFEAKLSKIPAFSGALSVSDEVAKMAMSEETSTILSTSDTPIQSHVVYDNGIVKNNAIQNIQLKDVEIPKFDLENHNILNQITDKLGELKGAQGHKLTLVLRPNDLGRVSIELKSDANGLTTNIIAQNSEVRSYIEKNIHNLRQSLVDSGINVNNIQIKTAGESQSSTYEGSQDQARDQQQEQQEQKQNQQNKKEKQETLETFSNFENQFKKDFSSVLNKTLSYNLN